ncbi:membrane-associated guanylate kinase, WW and PDZ domain-containing protein 2-like [Leptonychotes weddellii]|uniref:Membrane-associated guanylate kinase, WW and PDZ domain-containing protein 2-like n=1 Tax=Leptonychotes weddellii TaxID=9713 RepID=A0A7F8QR31_LEPWE|nr:membrane-associated guanylate kinase, WW and PDZ domain-containing protein 2-like [Leptonychotes weddellii]
MSKSLKKKSHWTSKVHESVIGRNPEGQLGFELKGGAENGQFPYLGEVKPGKVAYESGSKLVSEELLLEVNETPVAGLTIRDVLAVIKHCKDPLRLKCVKQGGIVDKDLRHYLNLRFQKGSVDHELQQIIRDNLYLRTVPYMEFLNEKADSCCCVVYDDVLARRDLLFSGYKTCLTSKLVLRNINSSPGC